MSSDIKMINGKYYDFTPNKNESFLITAKELKELGIKNYYFYRISILIFQILLFLKDYINIPCLNYH